MSAIDASADLHAAEWVKELRRLRPGIRVFGAGGVAMEKAGVEIVLPQRDLAVAGVVEVLGILPQVVSAWRRLERCVQSTRPGLAVLLDAPDFHLPLARRLKRFGLPLLYYIGPNVLRWRRGRVRTMARRADRLASIFPYEPALYAGTSLRVDYVGHPLIEPLREFAAQWDRRTAREALGLDPELPLVALAPGSRRNELRHMLRLFARSAALLRRREPRVRFALCIAPTLSREQIEHGLGRPAAELGMELVEGRSREVLVAADAALVKPGSITLEAALLGCPLVVAGRAHPLTAALLRRLVVEPSFTMPNVIAGRAIVPEFLQQEARPQALADAVHELLDANAAARQRSRLAVVRERLGDGATARRTAAIAHEMLQAAPLPVPAVR